MPRTGQGPGSASRLWISQLKMLLIGGAALALSACAAAIPLAPAPPCPAPQVDVTGWQEIDLQRFTFRLPPGFVEKEVQGIDVALWSFESDGNEVSAAWGTDADPLQSYRDMPGFTECEEVIGGKRARMVTFRTGGDFTPRGRLFAGAYWADVGGNHPDRLFVALSLRGISSDLSTHEQMLAMLRTVRFK